MIAETALRQAALGVDFRIFGIELLRLAEVLNGSFYLTEPKVGDPAVIISICGFGISAQCLIVIFHRIGIFLELIVGVATQIVSVGQIGIETQRFVVVFQRALMLTDLGQCAAPAHIGFGAFRIGFDGAIIGDDGVFVLAGALILDGLVKGIGCLGAMRDDCGNEKQEQIGGKSQSSQGQHRYLLV